MTSEAKIFLCSLMCILLLTNHVCDGQYLRLRNIGDRYGLFVFLIPARYINATLGPETYGWLVKRYGQKTVDKANILRAPTDSHACGSEDGWCKQSCVTNEKSDWTLKDVCGRLQCCVNIA